MKHLLLTLIFLILSNLAGCSMEGQQQVSIRDIKSNKISNITVLPLYQSSFGIGFGPDGIGPSSSSRLFSKPFSFNSDEDIHMKQLKGKGIFIPPVIYLGTTKYVDHWLFIKKGYAPVAVNRSQIYSGTPIVMEASDNESNKSYIELLVAKSPNQSELKKIFNASTLDGQINIELDTETRHLLKSNL